MSQAAEHHKQEIVGGLMQFEIGNAKPRVDSTAVVAPTAAVSSIVMPITMKWAHKIHVLDHETLSRLP
jgi:hypothetical protein